MAPSRRAAALMRKKQDKNALEVDLPQQHATGKGGKKAFAKADWKEGFKKKQVGVSDMTLLSTISNDSVNDNLQKRFENAEIYTYIGHVLISVNPFRMLPIYTDDVLHSYRGKNRLEMPPHVYAIAESAYHAMVSYKENQCVIISGESGAGKTEAAKRIMQYIAAVASESAGASGSAGGGIGSIKDMVLATNPLLESFGNAKTLRNNNSSRFGKYLEIEFNAQGAPVGATVTNYLLEKGRVVGQITNERNFHIFYQLTKGASAAQKETLGLSGPASYAYTAKSNCLDVPGIDDVAEWQENLQAMRTIGITDAEQADILRALAIILWLGNVTFREDAEGNSSIADASVPEFVAYLMEVDVAAVNKALTSRVMETQRGFGGAGGRRGSVYEVPLNPAQAAAARDALAKAIYSNLFDWIVERVNRSMKAKAASELVIGVLDIYGFEIFQDNSFEQLCINYVNEKLQQIFIELTLKTEQEEYVREQIKWTPIQYFNNKIVCDLIEEKKPPGIFAALNDACATAHADPSAADNSFVQRLGSLSSHPQFENRGGKFIVKHYAGDVTYNISGMTDKNKDVLNKDLLDLVVGSANPFLQGLFPDRPDPTSKKRPPTQGDKIKSSANALVDKLMRSQPSYIRTIKPNQNKSASEYDTKAILHQIKYLGLQENIRVRRAGFAYRNTFEKMVERFYLLSPATSYAGDYIWQGDSKSGCERILKDTGIAKEEWQMGVTKAFIKNPETLFALETMRDRYWHNMAARIQRAWRNYLRYRNECARRIQRFWMNKKEGLQYVRLRDYGHQVLAGRKERRRYSLVSMRQFRGDYLDVGGKSAFGQALRQACTMGGSETVAFSMRGEVLVSKLARSSKPSPRFIILTNGAIYILVSQLVQGRPSTTLERKIPLTTITSVGMSSLRDDWIALNTRASEEGDPVIWCVFKTEFVAHLQQQTNGAVTVLIGPTVEYAKKKDKKAVIKFIKDESVQRNDVYKSHEVRVGSGEPATSVSNPPAKRKAGAVRPVTQGKLLRPGGPGKAPAGAARAVPKPKPKPTPQTLPSGNLPAPPPPPPTFAAAAPAPTNGQANGVRVPPAPKVPGIAAGIPKAAVQAPQPPRAPTAPAAAIAKPSTGAGRAPPPPPGRPAAPPPAPSKPKWKVLYDFATQEAGEMALVKDELVEVEQKDENEPSGWWLVKKNGKTGWAPSNYLKEVPAARAAPPPAPAKRAPPPPGASAANGNARAAPPMLKPKPGGSGQTSGTATPTSNAGGAAKGKFGGGEARPPAANDLQAAIARRAQR